MARHTAIAENGASSARAKYIWSFPGSVTVQLSIGVVARIQATLENMQHGLLIGRAAGGVTEISDFKPLTAAELAAIRAASEVPDGMGKGLHPVGLFRVQEGGDLRLNPEDLAVAEAAFANPESVFLLIQRRSSGPANATFFFWDEGHMFGDFAFLEFPFDASALAQETAREGRIEAEREKRKAVAANLEVPATTPKRESQRRRLALQLVVVAGFFLTLAGATVATWIWTSRRPAPTQPAAAAPASAPERKAIVNLGLQVERQARGDVKLIWNREARAVMNATEGTLVIQDGPTTRVIPLDTSLVRGGSLLYSPSSDQVQMKLTVTGQESATELVLVVLPPRGSPQVQPLSIKKAAPKLVEGLTPDQEPAASVEAQPVRLYVPPAENRNKGGVDLPGAAPGVERKTAAVAPLADAIARPADAPPRPLLPKGENPKVENAAPPEAMTRVSDYVPPEPISRRVPMVPPNFRMPAYNKPEPVKVTVSIDETGRVVTAAASSENRLMWLNGPAETAARAWRFKPAHMGNQAVPSQMVLNFVFKPRQ